MIQSDINGAALLVRAVLHFAFSFRARWRKNPVVWECPRTTEQVPHYWAFSHSQSVDRRLPWRQDQCTDKERFEYDLVARRLEARLPLAGSSTARGFWCVLSFAPAVRYWTLASFHLRCSWLSQYPWQRDYGECSICLTVEFLALLTTSSENPRRVKPNSFGSTYHVSFLDDNSEHKTRRNVSSLSLCNYCLNSRF